MFRYVDAANRPDHVGRFPSAMVIGSRLSSLFDRGSRPSPSIAPRIGPKSPEKMTFVVKLRNTTTRMWGDQAEVLAVSAMAAAEQVAGESLFEGGKRSDLRVSVWPTPFGSQPCKMFYVDPRIA